MDNFTSQTSMILLGKDTSPKLGRVWAFIASFVLLAAGCAVLCLDVIALFRGEIWRLSRYHPGLVTRAANPESFWISAVGSFLISLVLIGNGVMDFKGRFLRKGH
jgi:hypothetical protein